VQYKYLYIDDIKADKTEESIETPISLAKGLSVDGIEIEYKHVFEFENNNFIKQYLSDYDGLLLDLRLDEYKDDNGKHSEFTATEFAQHIRTLVTKQELGKDLPIILFSTDEKLQQVYATDLSSHNLFDRYLTKVNTPDNASKKLYSLAKGYVEIEEYKESYRLNNGQLDLDEFKKTYIAKLIRLENLFDIDSRIFSRFSENGERIPTHEYAQVILKDLIYVTGSLINEDILSARLGIDKNNSDDWEKVKEFFENAKYKGVFSDGWNRWWMFEIDNLFESITGTYLSHLDAFQRVEVLKDKLSLSKLIVAEPIKLNTSTRYTTICKAYERPLDEMEGFRVYSSKEPKQWQEYEYASLEAFAVGKVDEKRIKVHVDDRDRLIEALEEL